MRHVILGTAGHIDHGKSSLVKAMTGVDPDRLKEEKERGITIDLGFAELMYEDGLSVGIVDVPGHERLIKNMLAGAGGIDMVLMVIAADEGIMPQSREHLQICDLLKIKSGMIAITKSDLVEPEWLDLVTEEVREFVKGSFLEGAPIVPVSSTTGENVDGLKGRIHELALECEPKPTGGLFRLPVDRVFTLKGFGTVVTGTIVSGVVEADEQVEVLPSNIKTKVRGLHCHGKPVKKIFAGQRGAINLQGVEKEDLSRGDCVVTGGRFSLTRRIDAYVEILDGDLELKTRSLVHFHVGTSETVARVVLYEMDVLSPGEGAFCQFRLNDSVVSQSGDRFIIRRFSPLETIGGGEVLDPSPSRRRRRDGVADLTGLRDGSLKDKVSAKIGKAALEGMTRSELEGWIRAEVKEIGSALGSLKQEGKVLKIEDVLIHSDSFVGFGNRLRDLLRAFHEGNPMKRGMPKEEARVKMKASYKTFSGLVDMTEGVSSDRDLIILEGFSASITQEERSALVAELEGRGFEPPAIAELASAIKKKEKQVSDILKVLSSEGSVVRLSDSMYMGRNAYDTMIGLLKKHFASNDGMTVAEFRDLLKTTRKYALPLLEHLDSGGVTLRVGDERKLLRK
ncbi:selenocysteine-specific translation elongation factor [Nitrospirota bacterium]